MTVARCHVSSLVLRHCRVKLVWRFVHQFYLACESSSLVAETRRTEHPPRKPRTLSSRMISFPAWSRRRLVATRSRRGLSSGFIIQMQLMRLMLKTFGTILESARTRTSAWAVRHGRPYAQVAGFKAVALILRWDFCWIWNWVLAARPTTSRVFGAMVCYDLSISRLETFQCSLLPWNS